MTTPLAHFRVRTPGIALLLAVCCGSGQPFAQDRATPRELTRARLEVPQLIRDLELAPGMTVADVGAGYGATPLVLTRTLGPRSLVYATEAGRNALAALHAMVAREKLEHVVVIEGTVLSTNLPAGCCDAAILRDVYHHLSHPAAIAVSLANALKPGGRLAIVDFEPEPGSAPLPGVPASRTGHGIAPDLVVQELRAAGLTHVRTVAPWPKSSGQDFYLILFTKTKAEPEVAPSEPTAPAAPGH
ncbi:MAG: class I SAM-dependent methyltransferase [Vicinamibacterales bacterium]